MASIYERIGGEGFFVDLVARFYARIKTDPVLRPMYPEDLEPAEHRLALFLIQYFGGPTTYDEERGHPQLRLRHMSFVIDQRARDIWLGHMVAALEEMLLSDRWKGDAKDDEILREYLVETSQFLINHGGLSILR